MVRGSTRYWHYYGQITIREEIWEQDQIPYNATRAAGSERWPRHKAGRYKIVWYARYVCRVVMGEADRWDSIIFQIAAGCCWCWCGCRCCCWAIYEPDIYGSSPRARPPRGFHLHDLGGVRAAVRLFLLSYYQPTYYCRLYCTLSIRFFLPNGDYMEIYPPKEVTSPA